MLPFTPTQFFDVFEAYNLAIWPAQVVAYIVAGLALLGARRGMTLALTSLALLWGWTGIAYHGLYFVRINPAAIAFAFLFVAQALLLAHRAVSHSAGLQRDGWVGWALIAYAVIVYPVLNLLLDHAYPRAPSFGVTPCPLVIFTFGVMALSRERLPWLLFAGPVLWSAIGGAAALLLGVAADYALPAAAVAGVVANARKPMRV